SSWGVKTFWAGPVMREFPRPSRDLRRPSVVDDRDVEAALRELRLHPAELVGVVVRPEAHTIADAPVRQRSLLHARLPPGQREARAQILGIGRRRERS